MFLWNLLTHPCQTLFETTVHYTATFLASILSHPLVEAAISRTLVNSMNQFITQDDLDQHFLRMAEIMSQNQPALARSAGQDFPKLVSMFVKGMLESSKTSNTSTTTNTVERTPPPKRRSSFTLTLTPTKSLEFPSLFGSSADDTAVSTNNSNTSTPIRQRWPHEPP